MRSAKTPLRAFKPCEDIHNHAFKANELTISQKKFLRDIFGIRKCNHIFESIDDLRGYDYAWGQHGNPARYIFGILSRYNSTLPSISPSLWILKGLIS